MSELTDVAELYVVQAEDAARRQHVTFFEANGGELRKLARALEVEAARLADLAKRARVVLAIVATEGHAA